MNQSFNYICRTRNRCRGLSLVEATISLSISAMLLAAVAVAFSASSSAIDNNDQFFRATQAARVTMTHLLTEIRRCTSIGVSANQIDMTADAQVALDSDRTYKFDGANKQIKLVLNDHAGAPEYVLAQNIESASFGLGAKAGNNIEPVAITIVVQVGGNSVRLTGSAVRRSEIDYTK